MRILFLCGSLEYGKDGVGDYTRKLAGELIRIGHSVNVIALNDRHLSKKQVFSSIQNDGEISIGTKRISSKINWDIRIEELQKLIEEFNPDWISLQYVPYSFNRKGLPIVFVNKISKIKCACKWHIMFHEIWVGISSISNLSHKLLGSFQKIIAKVMIKKLDVTLITTTNILYKSVLESAGIKNIILPLFSNIPFVTSDISLEKDILEIFGIKSDERNSWLFIGTFGTIYPDSDLYSAIQTHYKIAIEVNKKLAFVAFGRMSEYGRDKFEELKTLFRGKVKFFYLGELQEQKVSLMLQFLDYGISCTPTQHLGKSGVYAAMKLHSLPVTLSSYEYLPEYDKIISDYNSNNENCDASTWSVEYIASTFIILLSVKNTL